MFQNDPLVALVQQLLDCLLGVEMRKENALQCVSHILKRMEGFRYAWNIPEVRASIQHCISEIIRAFERLIRSIHRSSSLSLQHHLFESIEALGRFIGPLYSKRLFEAMENLCSEKNYTVLYVSITKEKCLERYLQALFALFLTAFPFVTIPVHILDLLLNNITNPGSLSWIHFILINQLPQMDQVISRIFSFTQTARWSGYSDFHKANIKEIMKLAASILYGDQKKQSDILNCVTSDRKNTRNSTQNAFYTKETLVDDPVNFEDEDFPVIVLSDG